MTPEHFKALISSQKSADRRLAGREAAANPTIIDRRIIEGAFHRETVPQIKQQFGAALEALNAQLPLDLEPPAKQAKEIYDEAHVKAMRAVSERVLHQLTPLVGDIEQSALAEIGTFETSDTKARIGQMKLQIDAIAKLYNAAKPAVFEEFDLAPVIKNCLPNDLDHKKCGISFVGTTPLLVQGDPSLITIAVTNALRNAIEACLPVADAVRKPSIVVNWGATDRDYWISILDEGVGFHGSTQGAFEIGNTTKAGHSGNGLPGIRSAMLSLSGASELIPGADAGCTLSLTWPIIALQKKDA